MSRPGAAAAPSTDGRVTPRTLVPVLEADPRPRRAGLLPQGLSLAGRRGRLSAHWSFPPRDTVRRV